MSRQPRFNWGRVARLLHRIPVSSRYFGPPRGYARDLAALTTKEGEELAILRPERTVHHAVPHLPAYPGIEKELRAEFDAAPAPAQRLYRLPQARVLGGAFGHGVITNADRLVLDQYESWGHEINNHPVHYVARFPSCSRIRGVSFSMISHWSENYWHWLFDVVGKLLLLRAHPPANLPPIDRYLVLDLSERRFKLQTLQALGLEESRLVDVTSRAHLLCDTLILAERPHRISYPEADVIAHVRRAFLPPDSAPPGDKRLYISRRQGGQRRILNEAELVQALEPLGFTEVFLENMDFTEQVKLFHEASAIVAPHGAGLTNLVFCRPGTQVFEILQPEYVNPCYAMLAEKLSLSYRMYLNGPSRGLFRGTWTDIPSEITVDVRAILDSLGPVQLHR